MKELELGKIYVPQKINHPVIDFLIFLFFRINKLAGGSTNKKKILLFQATVGKKPKIKQILLRAIVSHLYSLTKPTSRVNLKWYFVYFVANQEFKTPEKEVMIQLPVGTKRKNLKLAANMVEIKLPVYVIKLKVPQARFMSNG